MVEEMEETKKKFYKLSYGVVCKLRHAKNYFFKPPPLPLVTNFPNKEKFCVWTVTNSSNPLPPKAWRNLRTTPMSVYGK